jgi:CHASE2 domain-containing sensor protein
MRFWQDRPAVVSAAITTGIGLLAWLSPFTFGLDHQSFDFPSSIRPTMTPENAVVLLLNEWTSEANRSLMRSNHAALVRSMAASGAAAIVFDSSFTEDTSADVQLADAIQDAKNKGTKVLLATRLLPTHDGRNRPTVLQVETPNETLMRAAPVLASMEIPKGRDGTVRLHSSGTNLAWQTALALGKTLSKQERALWIYYYGAPNPIRSFSYSEVMSNAVSSSAFLGKAVFVGQGPVFGPQGEDKKDHHRTPFGREVPGVCIHATQYVNLVRGDWLTRFPFVFEAITLGVLGIFFGYGLSRWSPWTAAGLGLAAMIAIVAFALALFIYGNLWFNWMVVVWCQIPRQSYVPS